MTFFVRRLSFLAVVVVASVGSCFFFDSIDNDGVGVEMALSAHGATAGFDDVFLNG